MAAYESGHFLSVYSGRLADCTNCGRNNVKVCEGYDPDNPGRCAIHWIYPCCSACSSYTRLVNIRTEVIPPNPKED